MEQKFSQCLAEYHLLRFFLSSGFSNFFDRALRTTKFLVV